MRIFALVLALTAGGCTLAERQAFLRGAGEALGVVVVDADGDGVVDNADEVAARAASELAGKAARGDYFGLILSVIGIVGGGVGGYIAYRRKKING